MPGDIKPGIVALKVKARPIEVFMLVMMMLILLALVVGFNIFQNIQDEQVAAEQRGYKNRAVICDMAQALGLNPNPECDEVEAYRDEESATQGTTGAKNSKITLAVMCKLAEAQDVSIQECEG